MACTEVIEPLRGRGDALLQRAHLGAERGLVTDGARDTAEERRHLRARLREAEDVVDEEQHVLALFVAEVLGDGERARARRARGLRAARSSGRRPARSCEMTGSPVSSLRLLHLEVEVVAFARALADAGEARHAAVRLRDVVDELHG